jgi:uncharacterized protein YxeA
LAAADPEKQKRKLERELKRIERKVKEERQKFIKAEIRWFYKWLHSQDNYRQEQKEKAREAAGIYWRQNRSKVNEYQKKRHRTDPTYRLRRNLRTGLRNALKHNKKAVRTMEVVGCTPKQLEAHLERTLPRGFTMQDFLDGKLHIDHIIPLAVFDQSDMNQVRIAWNWQNLQLLPARINRLKHTKVHRPQLPLPVSFHPLGFGVP